MLVCGHFGAHACFHLQDEVAEQRPVSIFIHDNTEITQERKHDFLRNLQSAAYNILSGNKLYKLDTDKTKTLLRSLSLASFI
jgi:hypothetical protein